MKFRTAAIAVVASSLLAMPVAATALPAPDPPPRTVTDTVQVAIDQLVDAYARARLSEKRRIHNDIVLLMNIGRAAL